MKALPLLWITLALSSATTLAQATAKSCTITTVGKTCATPALPPTSHGTLLWEVDARHVQNKNGTIDGSTCSYRVREHKVKGGTLHAGTTRTSAGTVLTNLHITYVVETTLVAGLGCVAHINNN